MSFLVIDEKDNSIKCTREGELLPEVINLSKSDRNAGKKFVRDALKYVYHVYKREHMFSNNAVIHRKKKVIDMFLPDRKQNDFEGNKNVQALIKRYIDEEYLPVEWYYEGIKNDLKQLQEDIGNIPKKHTITVEYRQEEDGPLLKKKIEISNWKERWTAMQEAEKLIDMEERIKQKAMAARRKAQKQKEYIYDKES